MIKQGSYTPKGVCSRKIDYIIENGVVKKIIFTGGCDGNLSGISKLVIGMPVEQVIKTLSGTTCGFKSTSCPDQLAQALKKAQEE